MDAFFINICTHCIDQPSGFLVLLLILMMMFVACHLWCRVYCVSRGPRGPTSAPMCDMCPPTAGWLAGWLAGSYLVAPLTCLCLQAAASDDRSWSVWDLNQEKLRATWRSMGMIKGLAVAPDR